MHTLLEKIGAVIFSAGLAISSFFGFTPTQEPVDDLGGIQTVGGKTYTLYGSGIDSDDTSITLSSFTLPVSGAEINMANFGTIGYITIEPGSATKQEFVSFTGITANSDDTVTLTGVSRGLAPIYPYTASTTYAKAHSGGSVVVISNPPQLYNEAAFKGNNETITGQWTFENFPITASSSVATATTTGTVELATGGEAASSTLSSDIATSKLALHTGISTSSAPSSGNVVVVTGDDGNIDYNFLPSLVSSSTIQVFTATTSSSTWSKPANLKHIVVEIIGAGGAGGGNTTNAGTNAGASAAGGGGGAYCKVFISASQITGSTVSIGVGVAGASGGTGSGGSGGDSMFSGFATSTGGVGGGSGTSGAGGGGGTASGCTFGITGGNGENGNDASNSAGHGGDSIYGFGGTGGRNGSGAAGTGYGAGGGGAGVAVGDTTDGSGGNGTQGVVIVTEYF